MAHFLLGSNRWPPMPALHRAFLEVALARLPADARLTGLAAGGSFISRHLDEYSDLDLVVCARVEVFEEVLRDGAAIAKNLGQLLVAFPGDHVGEPRLLICLYGQPLLHVDLKFLTPADLKHRVEDPVVLWDRDGHVGEALAASGAAYPAPDRQWIEDRFWTWVHYLTVKIARGELFEAIDGLGYIRARVLGPLLLTAAGAQPNGVRRVESHVPNQVAALAATIAQHDRTSCARALRATIALYLELRERATDPLVRRLEAQRAAQAFLDAQLPVA